MPVVRFAPGAWVLARCSARVFMIGAALFAAQGVAAPPAEACGPVAEPMHVESDAHIRAIEHGLLPAVVSERMQPQTLGARMAALGVPGISVAVIRAGKLDWTRAWGLRDASTCAPVTTQTDFQAASISKTVAALAAMRLVERGRLALDEDIDTYLKTWKLPRNETLAPGFVTLRQLLSHTAGTTVHGFPGYAQGEVLPSVVQILDGVAPANSPAVRIELPPGKQFRYSGGGYEIVQLALSDVTGQAYAALAEREVFAPLGMRRSSVGAEPSHAVLRDAASAHANGSVIRGRFHRYPELAAAALWTTPSDLARLLIAVRAAAKGESSWLKPETARAMLQQQTDAGDVASGWGLGFALAGSASARRFGHDGRNEGFESTMTMYLDSGDGVVVLTNGDGGRQLAGEVVRALANEYGWPGLRSRKVAEVEVPAALLARYAGFYSAGPIEVWIEARDGRLYARIAGNAGDPLLALSPTRFMSAVGGTVAEFDTAADGVVSGLRIVEGGPPATLARSAPPKIALGAESMFLRGSMNDWSTQQRFEQISPGSYRVAIALSAGDYQFKVGSADWAAIDLGGSRGGQRIDDTGEVALVAKGANLRLGVAHAGVYQFLLTSDTQDRAILKVTRAAE